MDGLLGSATGVRAGLPDLFRQGRQHDDRVLTAAARRLSARISGGADIRGRLSPANKMVRRSVADRRRTRERLQDRCTRVALPAWKKRGCPCNSCRYVIRALAEGVPGEGRDGAAECAAGDQSASQPDAGNARTAPQAFRPAPGSRAHRPGQAKGDGVDWERMALAHEVRSFFGGKVRLRGHEYFERRAVGHRPRRRLERAGVVRGTERYQVNLNRGPSRPGSRQFETHRVVHVSLRRGRGGVQAHLGVDPRGDGARSARW